MALLLILGFPCLLVAAAVDDALRSRIPNGISLVLALLYLPAAIHAGHGAAAIAWHLAAGVSVLAAGLLPFALRWLGGGDVKLLSAAACWTGFGMLGPFLAATALAAGVLALVLLTTRRIPAGRLAGMAPFRWLFDRSRDMPCGPAIAAGGLAVFPMLDVVRTLLPGI